MRYIIVAIIITALFSACDKNRRNENPIAQVGDKRLYLSDITDIFPQGISNEDSTKLLTDYVAKWGRKQLILRQAENNLSVHEKDVTEELENYRASLLTFRYEQAYVAQRMDTLVSQSEMEAFYNSNNTNFALISPLIKAIYIKIPGNAPALKKIREIYRSSATKDIAELENLCYQGAVNYDNFGGDWIDFTALAKELPLDAKSYENELIGKRYIETSDQQFTYLISVKELKVKGDLAPFDHVKDNIKSIILNKRKLDLIKKLETDIYNNAISHNELKINIEK